MDSQEENKEITNPLFFPMLVSTYPGKDDSDEDINKRWDVFNMLPESEKDRMIAPSVAFTLKNIAEKYSFSEVEIADISRLVRNLFFGIISSDKIIPELQRIAARLSTPDFSYIGNTIMTKIMAGDYAAIIKKKRNTVNLTLINAISQYPNLGEQSVGSNPIKLRYLPDTVRPSIKNWITDYRDAIGSARHNSVERGNYIFHSQNVKTLTPIEQQKLMQLLKSLDEDALLAIDPAAQEVVFAEKTEEARPQAPAMVRQQNVMPSQRFQQDAMEYDSGQYEEKLEKAGQYFTQGAKQSPGQQQPDRYGDNAGPRQTVRNVGEYRSPDFSSLSKQPPVRNIVPPQPLRSIQPSAEPSVTFSSPQTLSTEAGKNTSMQNGYPKRSPYRIVPSGFDEER